MYAITGITGKVGGALSEQLLAQKKPVRAVLRDAAKAPAWKNRGCDVIMAPMEDAKALEKAFTDVEAVFILPPSDFDPAPGYPEARKVIEAVRTAIEAARPKRVLCLSTIGAQATQENLLTQRTLMEQALSTLPIPVAFLRPGWFMENAAWDVESAKSGKLYSFLQPLDKLYPMVATADVGKAAAGLIQQEWTGKKIVELVGPQGISPLMLAETFGKILGRKVEVEAVPRDTWNDLFVSQGMRHPQPRIRMLDGFNEGWIKFEGKPEAVLRGTIELEDVLRKLVDK